MDTSINTPDSINIMAPAQNINGASAVLRLIYDDTEEQYIATNMSMSSSMSPLGGGGSLRGKDLRSMPLRTRIRAGVRKELLENNKELAKIPAVKSYLKGTNGRKLSKEKIESPDEKTLQEIAIVYKLARMSQDFTNVAVSRAFGIMHFEAVGLVKLAKRLNYI